MYDQEVRKKIKWLLSELNKEIDGECHCYMSRLEGEWYHHMSVNFNYSNLQVCISIKEEILATKPSNVLLDKIIKGVKAEILSNYFK